MLRQIPARFAKLTVQPAKGGDPEVVRESQRARGASVELVDEVMALYTEWTQKQFAVDQTLKQINTIQKEITVKKKAKEDASELLAAKIAADKSIITARAEVAAKEAELRSKAGQIGNILDKDCKISSTEDDNPIMTLWHPEGKNHKGMDLNVGGLQAEDKTEGILSHHEVLHRLDAFDLERGKMRFPILRFSLGLCPKIKSFHLNGFSDPPRYDPGVLLTLLTISLPTRCQDCRSPRFLPRGRWCRSQPGTHQLRSRFPAIAKVPKSPSTLHDAKSDDGQDCPTGSIR